MGGESRKRGQIRRLRRKMEKNERVGRERGVGTDEE